jgi:hypothetical protein
LNGGTIDGITSLTAANDLDIGAHKLRANSLQADGMTADQVAMYGTDGVLSGDTDLTFSGDTLTATKIGAFEATGAINFGSQAMTNVDINSGTIDGITSLTASGNLDIGDHNLRALSLTADGQVSGRVAMYSTDGLLSGDADLTFNGDTLTAAKIGAFTAAGAIDFGNQDMTNVDIDSGTIDGVTISTSSTISTTGTGAITSAGTMTASTKSVIGQTTVSAAATITIPSTHSFVKITDDGVSASNAVTITTVGATVGQWLMIHNADAHDTTTIKIKSGRLMLLMYNGAAWVDISTPDLSGIALSGVTSLTAANDLDIGHHKLRANSLQADGMTADQVAMYGTDGVLSGDTDLTFSGDTLTATKLGAFTAAGAINFNSQAMTNVDINSGTIDGITTLTASGNLDIGNHNFRALSLTADGQVSGRVAMYSTDGLLSGDADLTFSGDTLTAAKIGAFTAAGAIDFGNQDMTNVDIDSGTIDGVTISTSSTISTTGTGTSFAG